jgi:PLP dependent protein
LAADCRFPVALAITKTRLIDVDRSSLSQRLVERVEIVEQRIQSACRRAGRRRDEVTLVAVTKSVSVDIAALLVQLGINDLAENRPQEFWRRAAILPNANWHFIGHLQRNKIERTLPLVKLLHSVDSLRLLSALDGEAVKLQRSIPVLLEVNASRETAKQGFAPDEISHVSEEVGRLSNIRVLGLMTMAAYTEDPENARSTFASLRQLRDQLKPSFPSPHHLEHLSMGMSNDFEIAIEEGATLLRLGTVFFEGVNE